MTPMLDHLRNFKKGDPISLVLAGMIVDGTFDEMVDDYIVLTDAKSPSIKKKHYTLKIPVESIYAWGKEQKKEPKKEKKKKKSE